MKLEHVERLWRTMSAPTSDTDQGDWHYSCTPCNEMQAWWRDHDLQHRHEDYPYYLVRDNNSEFFICTCEDPARVTLMNVLLNPKIVAGPYPTLDVGKVAWIMLFGN